MKRNENKYEENFEQTRNTSM